MFDVLIVFSWAENLMVSPRFLCPCRVQGKPKVTCLCIVLFYAHIEILSVLIRVI